MPDAAEPILLKNVWKLYGKTTALAGLSLAVPSGSVFGFLGPNGAGKSTAIRILLGLQRPSRGTVSLFGRQLPKGRVDILRRVGSMVESPSPYLHLTGRENLEVHTRLLGVTPPVTKRLQQKDESQLRASRATPRASMPYWCEAGSQYRVSRSNSPASRIFSSK